MPRVRAAKWGRPGVCQGAGPSAKLGGTCQVGVEILVAAFDFTTTYANHEKTERPNTVLGLLDLAGVPRRNVTRTYYAGAGNPSARESLP